VQLQPDFVREILLAIEADPKYAGVNPRPIIILDGHTEEETKYHVSRLIQAGLVDGNFNRPQLPPLVKGLTWDGHQYLENIRDPEIWKKTNESLREVGGFSFDLVKALAKGFIKKQIEDRTGVKLDL
jgi:Hypothetical protein (DUF2513)